MATRPTVMVAVAFFIFFSLAPLQAQSAETAPGLTLYGFFPSPPVMTMESITATFKAIGEHGELVLFARNVPWNDFARGEDTDSADLREVIGMVQLARQNGLEPVFLIDPLKGLDRRRFMGLPAVPSTVSRPGLRDQHLPGHAPG